MQIRTLRETDGPAFAAYRRDFLTNDRANLYAEQLRARLAGDADFAATYARTLANLTPDADWRVPQVDYYLFLDDGTIAGVVACRLTMTPALANSGGHIGYAVAPSQRGRGYAQRLLQFALDFFRARHEPFVIISAYAGNTASRHVIERAGGVLQRQVPVGDAGEMMCIYHLELVAK